MSFYFVLVCFDIFCLIGLFPICFFLKGGDLLWFCFLSIFKKGEQREQAWVGRELGQVLASVGLLLLLQSVSSETGAFLFLLLLFEIII